MIKTISVTEAKNKLSTMLQLAAEKGDEIIIESRGEPKGVILAYDDYRELLALREAARRREALRQLELLAEQIWARNSDLSEEEVEQLAEEITQETIQRMIKEGKVRFQS